MRAVFFLTIVAATSCLLNAADGGLKATVTTIASVDVLPAAMDVVLTLKQKGANAKAAAEALKTAREAALVKLAALGFKTDLARSENPSVVDKSASSALQNAIAARSGNRLKRKEKKDDAPPEVQIQQVVRVPFPLAGKDMVSIVVETDGLKTAVRGAKLIAETAGDDTEDDAESAAALQNMYPGTRQKGSPLNFEFTAPRTAELEQHAYSDALKKAREKATNIAIAAGLKSAELSSITSQETDAAQMDEENPYYRPSTRPKEVMSSETPALSLTVSLVVECLLK